MRRRVLLIDLDPQGNATTGCGIDKSTLERGCCEVLLGECTLPRGDRCTLDPAAPAASSLPLDVLPANQDLTAAEVRLLALPQRPRAAAAHGARADSRTTTI